MNATASKPSAVLPPTRNPIRAKNQSDVLRVFKWMRPRPKPTRPTRLVAITMTYRAFSIHTAVVLLFFGTEKNEAYKTFLREDDFRKSPGVYFKKLKKFFSSTSYGPNVPIFPVSAKNQVGFEELKQGILKKLKTLEVKRNYEGSVIIPIDHHFSIKGRGAVITGGDRTDLALAALNEDVSCLILTGFIQPDIKLIAAANERNIPLILSPSDTYTTMRNMMRLKPGIQEDEIKLVQKLVEDGINWEILLK